jgi:hypothetical protein
MRTQEEIQRMLDKVEAVASRFDEGDFTEVEALREALVWVLHPETGDGRVTDFFEA